MKKTHHQLLSAAAILLISVVLGSCQTMNQPVPAAAEVSPERSVSMARVIDEIRSWQPSTEIAGIEELRGTLIDALVAGGRDRITLAAPGGSSNAVSDLAINNNNAAVSWTYVNVGDYDQNGEVNAADLTPVAIHFGKTPASTDWIEAQVADGDNNLEVNLGDIQPIAVNFLNTVAQYNLYSSTELLDYPAGPDDPNGGGAVLDSTIDFSLAATPPGFKTFTANISSPVDLTYYWVRPSDSIEIGATSNNVQYDQPIDPNDPPNADLTATPLSGELPLDVDFDASGSTDLDGTIDLYEWDWDGAAGGFNWEATGNTPTAMHTYDVQGTYDAVVRVTDNEGATDSATVRIVVTEPVIIGIRVSGIIQNSMFLPPEPMPGITVHLSATDGSGYTDDVVSTAPDGEYEFLDVPEGGKYEVWCDDPLWSWPPGRRPVPIDGSPLSEDVTFINISANGPA